MRSRFMTAVLSALLGGGLLSCGKKDREVRIGCVAPLTGDNAAFGRSNQQGFQLALEEWNAKGGVLGHPLVMVLADDKGDAGEGATVFTKLVERDKVAVLVGPSLSKVAMAGAPITQAAHLPMVTPACTSPGVTAVGDYIFRACFVDTVQGSVGAGFAYRDLKARKAACLFDLGNDYTLGLAQAFRTAFTALGGRMAGFEGHATGAVDFRPQLTKLLQGGPDLLYLPDYYGDVALIARQARELGFKGPLLGGDGWDSPQLHAIGGSALENGYYTTHCSKDDPDPYVRRFVKAFQDRFHADPDAMAMLGYDACTLAFDALQRAGTTEGPAVREALARTDLRIVSGQIKFDAQRNPVKPITLVAVQNGRPVFLRKAHF